jgi:hypothetical protein
MHRGLEQTGNVMEATRYSDFVREVADVIRDVMFLEESLDSGGMTGNSRKRNGFFEIFLVGSRDHLLAPEIHGARRLVKALARDLTRGRKARQTSTWERFYKKKNAPDKPGRSEFNFYRYRASGRCDAEYQFAPSPYSFAGGSATPTRKQDLRFRISESDGRIG